MKRVLVISGSPRSKGNTFKIAQIVETKIKALGEVEFEYLSLKKINLAYCCGCLACMKKGDEHCPWKDEAISLRNKMTAADGVIFISPVYVHTVSALMKNFYDRFAYFCHQPRFLKKPALNIVTTELSGGEETLKYMAFPPFTWGFHLIDGLDVVYDAFLKEGPYRVKSQARIEKSAHDFYTLLTTPRQKPTFKELLFFNIMKTKVTLHRDMLPQDYLYWREKGWLNKTFYHQQEVSPWKSLLARCLVKIKVRNIINKYGFKVTD